jgi:hypothetical protein
LWEQEAYLRYKAWRHGLVVAAVYHHVGRASDRACRRALADAAEGALFCGAVALMSESVCRFVRHPDFHPSFNPEAQPTDEQIAAVFAAVNNFRLVTVCEPECSSRAVKRYQEKRARLINAPRPLVTKMKAGGVSAYRISRDLNLPQTTALRWCKAC